MSEPAALLLANVRRVGNLLRGPAQNRGQRRVRTRTRCRAEARRHLRAPDRRDVWCCGTARLRSYDVGARRSRSSAVRRFRSFLHGQRRRTGNVRFRVGRDFCGESDRFFELFAGARLRQVSKYLAFIDRCLDGLQVCVAGQQNPHCVRCQPLDRLQHFDAGHAGHPLVGDDHVHAVIAQQVDCFLAAVGEQHFVVSAEHRAHRRQHATFVVDEQKRAALRCRFHQAASASPIMSDTCSAAPALMPRSIGRLIVIVVPTPTFESTMILPPCSSTIRRTIDRPRPVP